MCPLMSNDIKIWTKSILQILVSKGVLWPNLYSLWVTFGQIICYKMKKKIKARSERFSSINWRRRKQKVVQENSENWGNLVCYILEWHSFWREWFDSCHAKWDILILIYKILVFIYLREDKSLIFIFDIHLDLGNAWCEQSSRLKWIKTIFFLCVESYLRC
jgi:hypothetical protein